MTLNHSLTCKTSCTQCQLTTDKQNPHLLIPLLKHEISFVTLHTTYIVNKQRFQGGETYAHLGSGAPQSAQQRLSF